MAAQAPPQEAWHHAADRGDRRLPGVGAGEHETGDARDRHRAAEHVQRRLAPQDSERDEVQADHHGHPRDAGVGCVEDPQHLQPAEQRHDLGQHHEPEAATEAGPRPDPLRDLRPDRPLQGDLRPDEQQHGDHPQDERERRRQLPGVDEDVHQPEDRPDHDA